MTATEFASRPDLDCRESLIHEDRVCGRALPHVVLVERLRYPSCGHCHLGHPSSAADEVSDSVVAGCEKDEPDTAVLEQ
jgi:hypothetical protein